MVSSGEALRASRSLVAQLRIVYSELVAAHPSPVAAGGSWSPSSAAALQAFGRRYAAEMYLCAQDLRDQEADPNAGEDTEETRAELQRTLWAICIWELSVLVFIGRPALLTESLLPWWQLHLSDRRVTEHDLPSLEALEQPDTHPEFWPTIRQLIARGLPELALRLLKQHAGLRMGDGDSTGEQALLERLETLLELMPRLAEPELMQPQREEAPLGQLEQAALRDFKLRHQVWSSDLEGLARDASAAAAAVPAAQEVAATARLLSGDDAAISSVSEWWHGKLIGRLLYQQPTTLRWQLRDLLKQCLPQGGTLDVFQSSLVAILSDDPYAALRAIREAYGDGWLLAHLWDLLWRAGAVGANDPMGDTGMDVRSYLMLQHAKAVGACPSLWQVSALYAADLAAPSLSTSGAAAGMTQGTNAAAAAEARAWLRQLVLSQQPVHTMKLRKLLLLCEQHGMRAEAEELVSRATEAKRGARAAVDVPVPLAKPPMANGGARTARTASQTSCRSSLDAITPLIATASRALEEAIAAASADGASEEGPAVAEIRALLRCEGIGGGQYYAGPRWLPPFFALLELLATPHTSREKSAPAVAIRAKEVIISLAAARTDVVGDSLPDALMLRLLRFLAGGLPHAPSHELLILGRPCIPDVAMAVHSSPPPLYSVADVQLLLRQLEWLKGSVLSLTPAEGPNSRAQDLSAEERALSLALSAGLASAILEEAARSCRGSCWGAGI